LFLHRDGPRTRRVLAYLKRREKAAPSRRREQDGRALPRLSKRLAIVYTDTADFTVRTARDGILHFLMVFNRLVERARPLVRRRGGELVKVEADSLLIRFPDADTACRGVEALERLLRQLNRGRPHDERLRFSYGVGYGDLLEVDGDLFGLEMNLASKLGEDLARPGEVLLTPSAVAAVGARVRRRLVAHPPMKLSQSTVPTRRLRLRRL
jgi:class 3 adenylate cyclase